MPPKKKAAKKTSDYEMAEYINSGTVIKDVRKNEFVVGEPVGQGGFGMIYLTDYKGSGNDIDTAKYVIKIEPKKNGPLFAEVNFYMRVCKPDHIDQFCKQRKIAKVGIPKFMTQGIHTYNGNDLRYLIMPRFGRDLHKLFLENGSLFNREFCAQIAHKMLYSLEYMHNKRYAHADIKGANILLGNENTSDKEELFLIDFGLAYLVPNNPQHRPDPKCKHDGTIEYCSTDAHDGCKPSFRGDLEILVWCLAHWSAGTLPWIELVKENMTEAQKDVVATRKKAASQKPDKFLKDLGIGDRKELQDLLKYASSMEYGDEVDFDKCRAMFSKVLPKGKALALKKVKSRKSFVKLAPEISVARTPKEKPKKRTTAASVRSSARKNAVSAEVNDEYEEPSSSFVITPKKAPRSARKKAAKEEEHTEEPKPRKRAAAKSLKRTVEETSSKEDEDCSEDEPTVSVKPSRKQQKRGAKTPAKQAEAEPEPEVQVSRAETSNLRKRTIRLDSEITGVFKLGEDTVNRSSRSTRQTSRALKKEESTLEESTIESEEESVVESGATKTNASQALLFGDSSSDDSISVHEFNAQEKENSPPEEEPARPQADKPVSVREKKPRKKKMLQPGKLINPTDNSCQTVRPNGRTKSWLMEHPAEAKKLRQWLKGERASFK